MGVVVLDVDAIALPNGIHAAMLTGRDVVTGEQLAYPVVWADRPYDACPGCHQPVERVIERCPAHLNTGAGQGGAIEGWSQQHGCGEWLAVDWTEIHPSGSHDDLTDDILSVAATLRAQLTDEITRERQRIRACLRRDLAHALTCLAEPLDTDETREDRADYVRSGSDTEPGVYRDDEGRWVAWDYDPDGSGDAIRVFESDLATESTRG